MKKSVWCCLAALSHFEIWKNIFLQYVDPPESQRHEGATNFYLWYVVDRFLINTCEKFQLGAKAATQLTTPKCLITQYLIFPK